MLVDMMLDEQDLSVEALAIARQEYYWYRLKSPITLSRYGGDVRLVPGDNVGVRPSHSDPTKLRIITDKLPPSMIFTVDLDAFQKLAKHMAGLGKKAIKDIENPTTPVDAVVAKFDAKKFVSSFSTLGAMIEYLIRLDDAMDMWFDSGEMNQEEERQFMQFRHFFALTSKSGSIHAYRYTDLEDHGKKIELQEGMYIKLKTTFAKGKGIFQSWSHKPVQEFDGAKFLLKTEAPLNLVLWCPAMSKEARKALAEVVVLAKKRWKEPPSINLSELKVAYNKLRKQRDNVWKLPIPYGEQRKQRILLTKQMDKIRKQLDGVATPENLKKLWNQVMDTSESHEGEQEVIVAVKGFKNGFVPCQIVKMQGKA